MATKAHCAFCFETLTAHLEERPALSLPEVEALWSQYESSLSTSAEATAPGPSPTANYPVFITYNTLTPDGDKHLRGCIGTFRPEPLSTGLSTYALTAALEDTRFAPITARDLPPLECGVTLLTDFEPAASALDWVVGTHGIRIAFEHRGRRLGATYLPDVAREQGWGKEDALRSLMRKAGWRGPDDEWKAVALRLERYQGRKVGLAFAEWRAWRAWVDGRIG